MTAPAPAATAEAAARPQRSTARDAALRVLVNSSVELARLVAVQKAVLRVHMPVVAPRQRVPFSPDAMEDVGGGDDDDALARRSICAVVFPGLVKHGDEGGRHLQLRNVIAKASVVCRRAEP